MGKEKKTAKKKKFLNFKGMRIQERLKKAFNLVILVAMIASIVGVVAIFIITANYKKAMNNFAMPQGEIGMLMNEHAECRSAMRGIIGYEDQKEIDLMVEQHAVHKDKVYELIDVIKPTLITDEGKQAMADIENALTAYFAKEAEVIKIGSTTDQELCRKAQQMAINEMTPLYDAVDVALVKLMDINVDMEHRLESILAVVEIITFIFMGVLIVSAIVIAKRISYVIAKGIAKPLAELEKNFDEFANGNLGVEFPTSSAEDEIAGLMNSSHDTVAKLNTIIADIEKLCEEMGNGNFAVDTKCEDAYVGDFKHLLDAMRKMNDNVSYTLTEVNQAAEQVNAGAVNLAEAAQDLAEGATDQAASVQEMVATMNTLTEGLKGTVNSVEEAYAQATKCAESAQISREEMGNMVHSMNRISETSKKIENIIAEIEDIASQTNLLSLNASIEAARAGEAGRGFAVVADQIRVLADQSAKSAVDTRALVEDTIFEIEEGNKVVYRTSDVLDSVVNAVQKIADSAKLLRADSEQQMLAMAQADAGIESISEIVQSNSAAAEETSATSEELSAQAISMHDMVARFQLKER